MNCGRGGPVAYRTVSAGQAPPEGLGRPFALVGALVLAGFLVTAGVGAMRIASPATADVEHADAVAVHASGEERLDTGLALVRSGVAPVLVVSDAAGEDYGRGGGFMDSFCGREEPFEVICRVPEPNSTIGEARAFGALAEQRGWQRVAVVTSREHLTRARLAVSQCTDAEVLPVAANPGASPDLRKVRDEWLRAAGTATVVRACW